MPAVPRRGPPPPRARDRLRRSGSRAFARTSAGPNPSLHDPPATAIAALQGGVPIQATPTTLVLDRAGNVAVRVLGTIDPSVLRPLLDDVLAEQA